MRRLLRLNNRTLRKGQWFLISAVVISGAFLIISVLLKDYLIVDQSVIARMDEDFYFHNIKEGLNTIVDTEGYDLPNCDNLKTKLDEFRVLSERRMAANGYYLYVENIDNSVDCDTQTSSFGILLASDRMVIYENVNPEDVIPNI